MAYLKSIVVMLIVISLSGCISSESGVDNQNNIEENNKSTKLEMVEIFLSRLDTESLEDDAYYVFIIDENYEILKTYTFYEKGKKQIKWEGKYKDGSLCPDGLYHVIVYSPPGVAECVSRIFIKSSEEQDEGMVD